MIMHHLNIGRMKKAEASNPPPPPPPPPPPAKPAVEPWVLDEMSEGEELEAEVSAQVGVGDVRDDPGTSDAQELSFDTASAQGHDRAVSEHAAHDLELSKSSQPDTVSQNVGSGGEPVSQTDVALVNATRGGLPPITVEKMTKWLEMCLNDPKQYNKKKRILRALGKVGNFYNSQVAPKAVEEAIRKVEAGT